MNKLVVLARRAIHRLLPLRIINDLRVCKNHIILATRQMGAEYANQVVARFVLNSGAKNDLRLFECSNIDSGGFYHSVCITLQQICFAKRIGFEPYVNWTSNRLVKLDGPQNENSCAHNLFEQYWRQKYTNRALRECSVCIPYDLLQLYKPCLDYFEQPAALSELAGMYKQYFVFNEKTKNKLREDIKSLCVGDFNKTIAVHVRGTDFKCNFAGHAVFISFGQYVKKAKELLHTGKYEKVFLATDDEEALNLFKREFTNKLVYYKGCMRSTGNTGVHMLNKNRDWNFYYDIIRDVYTLACCGSLVCCSSNVALAAKYVKLSKGSDFYTTELISEGTNPPYRRGGDGRQGRAGHLKENARSPVLTE